MFWIHAEKLLLLGSRKAASPLWLKILCVVMALVDAKMKDASLQWFRKPENGSSTALGPTNVFNGFAKLCRTWNYHIHSLFCAHEIFGFVWQSVTPFRPRLDHQFTSVLWIKLSSHESAGMKLSENATMLTSPLKIMFLTLRLLSKRIWIIFSRIWDGSPSFMVKSAKSP